MKPLVAALLLLCSQPNAPGPVFSRGSETNAQLTLDDLSLYLGYTFTDARQQYLPGHPYLPLTPRNRFVSTLSYEAEPNSFALYAVGPSTGLKMSPSLLIRSMAFLSVNCFIFSPFFTSSQCRGMETVAPGLGRTE